MNRLLHDWIMMMPLVLKTVAIWRPILASGTSVAQWVEILKIPTYGGANHPCKLNVQGKGVVGVRKHVHEFCGGSTSNFLQMAFLL